MCTDVSANVQGRIFLWQFGTQHAIAEFDASLPSYSSSSSSASAPPGISSPTSEDMAAAAASGSAGSKSKAQLFTRLRFNASGNKLGATSVSGQFYLWSFSYRRYATGVGSSSGMRPTPSSSSSGLIAPAMGSGSSAFDSVSSSGGSTSNLNSSAGGGFNFPTPHHTLSYCEWFDAHERGATDFQFLTGGSHVATCGDDSGAHNENVKVWDTLLPDKDRLLCGFEFPKNCMSLSFVVCRCFFVRCFYDLFLTFRRSLSLCSRCDGAVLRAQLTPANRR
jgi:hypothetical protein